ncbi:ABC transporter ATP-binding protein [Methylobacterium aquaticum]|uniref:ABC transporter ATP-binding protein n=1 Tax=Methylobacterium aquaticum TaxID=270351 RepID=UPI000B2679F8|nr:ABC transporter ATP-binding protein [Methylobacterium aquaticum]
MSETPVTEPLLRIDHVTLRFGGLVANADVSLAVPEGQILGLLGPNGAGKSTLFNLISGTYRPSEGRIVFRGEDITDLSAPERCRRGIARTFQVPRSFDSMNVLENVVVGGFARHATAAAARRVALETLDFAGLGHRADAVAGELTPPEKRRLEVARALATEPTLLLLDEVLTGLTPSEAKAGVELIRKVAARGVTVIMVEHVMEVVMPLVDRAVVLHLGRVLAEGHPTEVVRHDGVITAYLGERHRAA